MKGPDQSRPVFPLTILLFACQVGLVRINTASELDLLLTQEKTSKSTVLVSAIYNGWLDITRKMIDNRQIMTNIVDSGKATISKV